MKLEVLYYLLGSYAYCITYEASALHNLRHANCMTFTLLYNAMKNEIAGRIFHTLNVEILKIDSFHSLFKDIFEVETSIQFHFAFFTCFTCFTMEFLQGS
jgi:hypothetical protein